MLSNWRNWCRLCANECAVYKLESLDELNEITMRHFKFSLQELNDVCNCICEECYNFINKLDRFKERCLQTSKMLVELSSACTEDDELLESDVQDLRFRFLSDSILTTADVEQEDKPLVPGMALAAQDDVPASSSFEQPVDTNDMVAQNLVELRIEKMSPGKRKKRMREEMTLSDKEMENEKNEMLEHIVQEDRLLTDLPDTGFRELSSNVRLMHDSSDTDDNGENLQDDDYNMLDELDTDSETDNAEVYDANTDAKQKKSSSGGNSKPPLKTRCEICDKSFRTRSMYVLHLQTKHPDSEELSFACSSCPKRFPSERKAKMHELVHLPNEQKLVHPCKYCDKKFSKLVNVQAHIKAVHIGERPYICEECGKAFSTKGALKEHQITHSDEKPYQCAHCPKKFKNLPRLKTHEDTHNDTLYVCPHCGLQLNTKRTLKMHMVVHSDQKKFKCQYCGNEYKRSKALKNHLILHTGLRPYQCPFCEKTFANGSNCRSHKKKAHPQELAALEASGEHSRATNIPKLDQLQPKPHQMASLPGTQTAPPTAATALIQPSSSEDTSTTLPASTASQQQPHQQQATAATIIATASPPATSSTTTLVEVPSSSEELVLHRGVRLVTAYFHSQNEPPPLNILSTANIKQDDVPTGIVAAAAAAIGGRLQQSVMDQGRGVGFQPTLVIRQQEPRAAAVSPPTEQVQLTTVSEVVSLPPLQLISTNNL